MTHGEPSNPSQRRSVLIADGDVDTCDMYAISLRYAGFDVLAAHDGPATLSLATAARPDVIVTEVRLPHVDGVELLLRMQADPRTSHIPVIVLTGWSDSDTLKRAAAAGATTVLMKPCLPTSLVKEISRLLPSIPRALEAG